MSDSGEVARFRIADQSTNRQEWVASAAQSFEVTVSMLQNRPVQIGSRPALEHDFEYCRRLYFAEMRWIIDELRLDRNAQKKPSFGQQWNRAQVRVIALTVPMSAGCRPSEKIIRFLSRRCLWIARFSAGVSAQK